MIAACPLRTAQATRPAETGAQDGLPTPLAVPVDTKLPQLAHAEGANTRAACKNSKQTMIRFIDLLQVVLVNAPPGCFNLRRFTAYWSRVCAPILPPAAHN